MKELAKIVEDSDHASIQVKVGGRIVVEYTEDVGMTIAEYTAGVINKSHDEAVKAERERCARVVESSLSETMHVNTVAWVHRIANEIRGMWK